MKTINETIPEIIAELAQAQALDRSQILKYRERFSSAWRREKDATRARIYRLNKKSRMTNTVTGSVTGNVTNTVTNSVTQGKEERTEKENLPPTPPIREKAKKEEMPPAAATRASRVRGECPSWEQVKERAEVSLKCRDLDWLREWFAEQECSAWHDGNGNPMRNWGRALAIAWRYREVDAARRDPERRFADGRAGETEIAGDLIAKQMAELGKAVR